VYTLQTSAIDGLDAISLSKNGETVISALSNGTIIGWVVSSLRKISMLLGKGGLMFGKSKSLE